jgi:hypothetical protein
MRTPLLCLVLTLAWALPASAALTLISRETFQNVGTVNSANPESMLNVTGNFYKRAVGPRLSNDTSANSEGWSADIENNDNAYQVQNSATVFPASAYNVSDGIFAMDWWVYLAQPVSDGSNGKTLLSMSTAGGNLLLVVNISAKDGLSLAYQGNGATNATPYTIPVGTWVNFRVVWTKVVGGFYDYNLAFEERTRGGAWNTLINASSIPCYANITSLINGFENAGGTPPVDGRYGMPSVYKLDAWTDRTLLVSDVVDPPSGPFTWYCNPSTGSDTNDGTTKTTAWASVSKINLESANLGIFPNSTGYASGDTLVIDTTKANLILGSNCLNLLTPGLNVTQLGGGLTGTGEIQAWEAISSGSWTGPVTGTSHVYKETLTSHDPSAVLWENDLWMNHITGANLAAVQSSLDSTAGSFWTDGTTMYCHPFNNTNPISDGKSYTRSYNRNGTGGSAVFMLAPNLHLNGLRVRKTCLADMATNDPVAAYCYQSISAAGGNSLIENCYGAYSSKHIFGYTDNSITRAYTTSNCEAEQASPYAGVGGQTAWVDYANSPSSNGSATSVYTNCVTKANAGLIGSTAGQVLTTDPAWLSHNSGAGQLQFAEADFNNCQLAGPLETYNAISTVRVTGGSCSGGSFNAVTSVYVNGVQVNSGVVFSGGNYLQVQNSIISLNSINGGFVPSLGPTTIYEGCTIDLTATTSNTVGQALFGRTSAMAFTWRNNLVLGSTTNSFAIVKDATAADHLTFDHNAYENISSVLFGYVSNSKTSNESLAQWQALGYDSGSFNTTNPVLTNYFPGKGSPLINAGADLELVTPATNSDITGTTYPYRTTIGAYEDDAYLTPQTISGLATTQTITFPGGLAGTDTLNVTSSSGLPVTYSVAGLGASFKNNVLTLTQNGIFTITVYQAGTASIAPAVATETLFVSGIITPQSGVPEPVMPWLGLVALFFLLAGGGMIAMPQARDDGGGGVA